MARLRQGGSILGARWCASVNLAVEELRVMLLHLFDPRTVVLEHGVQIALLLQVGNAFQPCLLLGTLLLFVFRAQGFLLFDGRHDLIMELLYFVRLPVLSLQPLSLRRLKRLSLWTATLLV